MYIVVTLQPLEITARKVDVPITIQLGDLRKEAAQFVKWHEKSLFSGPCSIAMAVGEIRRYNMYSTLAKCGVKGDTLVTLIRIPVPLSITDAEDKMPEALKTMAAVDQALQLWISPDAPITCAPETKDFMTPSEML